MSYRIHLEVYNKKELEEYVSKYDPNDEHGYFHPDDYINCLFRSEIFDETPISKFKDIDIPEQEYHPKILTKEDFLSIIKLYQKHLHELATKRVDKIAKVRKELNTDENKVTRDLSTLIFSVNTQAWNIQHYFDTLIKRDILIMDSDYFLLQYFMLVRMYEEFDDEKNVLIITHG